MEQHSELPQIETGYEGYNPLTGEISQTLTNVRVIIGLITKAQEKGERGYIDYVKKLNSHHLLKAVSWISKIYPAILDRLNLNFTELEGYPERLEILNKVYTACRILDDAVDGDSPRKLTADETEAYATGAVDRFESESFDPRNAVDAFLEDALDKCNQIGLDIKQQILCVLKSVQFDAKRRSEFLRTGIPWFYSEEELQIHYHQMDIQGTVGAMLELTGEGDSDPNQLLITPLAKSCRYFYDVRDLVKEVKQGLVNISKEEAKRFGIDIHSLYIWANIDGDYGTAPEGVKAWISEKIREGQKLLKKHQEQMQEASFNGTTNEVLDKSFVSQCEPFYAMMIPLVRRWGY